MDINLLENRFARRAATGLARCMSLLTVSLVLGGGTPAFGIDWMTLPSTYTHAPSGARVNQYRAPQPAYTPQVANFRSSGYSHVRSSMQFGASADNYHRVEEWGDPVRPYGEWRFPYRPYSQPYAAWGPPLAGLGGIWGGYGGYGSNGGYGPGYPGGGQAGPGHPGGGRPGSGHPGGGYPPGVGNGIDGGSPLGGAGRPYPSLPGTGYAVPPYYDGSYPSTPYVPPMSDEQFYYRP